jgi:hypothetical protein
MAMARAMPWMRKIGLMLAVGGVAGIGCAETPATAPAARPTVGAIAQSPAAWVDKEATLTGRLANQGANYFTDLRVVLKDDSGHVLAVKPWLPTALPPAPPGAGGGATRPRTLAQFLGRKVELEATVRYGSLNEGDTYYLEVKQARTVD